MAKKPAPSSVPVAEPLPVGGPPVELVADLLPPFGLIIGRQVVPLEVSTEGKVTGLTVEVIAEVGPFLAAAHDALLAEMGGRASREEFIAWCVQRAQAKAEPQA